MGTMKKVNKSQKMLIILPIIILLGVLIFVVTPKGPILKALSDHELVEVSNMDDDKTEKDQIIETEKEIVKIQIVAKETGLYTIKKKPGFSVTLIDEKNEQLTVPILEEKNYTNFYEIYSNPEAIQKDSSGMELESSKITEKAPEFAQITSSGKLTSYYLNLNKGVSQCLRIERNNSESIKVELQSTEDEKKSQVLVDFKDNKETNDLYQSEEITTEIVSEENRNSTKEEKNNSAAESDDGNSTSKKSEPKQSVNNTVTTETKDEEEKVNQKDTEEKSESLNQNKKQEETKATGKDVIESPNDYERILFVETKETEKNDKELERRNYTEKDSLKKPVFIKETATQTKSKIKSEEDPAIIVRDAKLSVKTGTSEFDNDNNPGNDASEENDIVRTFDQISYLTSFSIQNTKKNIEYTDIRYRVIAEMPNAVEVTDTIPRNNGEIANGMYIDNSEGDGSQVSEGVMESVISDTGQVFVPIILNVYGSSQGKKIQPTIKLEIVNAKNVETGEIESFNKVYDINTLLEKDKQVPITIVSAKPSIGVQLVRGQTQDSSVFGVTNSNINAYDVGIVTVLQELVGREKGDYKGSTFPNGKITYQIKQKATYRVGAGTDQVMPQTYYDPLTVRAVSTAVNNRNEAEWSKNGTVDLTKFNEALDSPNGETKKIYTSEPTEKFSEIGVYDSGKFTTTDGNYLSNVSNENYAGTLNPYTYTMRGNRTQAATDKAFSSGELIYYWDRTKSENLAKGNNWSRYDMTLYIDSVTYDGISTSNDSSLIYPNIVTNGTVYKASPAFAVANSGTHYDAVNENYFGSLAPGALNLANNYGTNQVETGQDILFMNYLRTTNQSVKSANMIFMWDPLDFKFDSSRKIGYAGNAKGPGWGWTPELQTMTVKYGVAKAANDTPAKARKVGDISYNKAFYNWFDKYEDAIKTGDISAVTTGFTYEGFPKSGTIELSPTIPVTVEAAGGTGKSLVLLSAQEWLGDKGNVIYQAPDRTVTDATTKQRMGVPDSKGVGTYYESSFYNTGEAKSVPNIYFNFIGDSAVAMPFGITTKTNVKKNMYQSNEDIDIKVTGVMSGSDTVTYDGSLTTTLPKGISYKSSSSYDANGELLKEPDISENDDGSICLRWTFNDLDTEQRKKGIEVNFKAQSDFSRLSFKENGYTDSLVVKTIGEMWVSGNPSLNDKRDESIRSSQDEFIVLLIQQIILSKKGNKPAIELGETDPLGVDNTITYKVKMINNSAASIPEARVLDVLPYDGDSRGTKYSGNYTIEELTVNDTSATISYTNSSTSESADPNQITGWSNYVSGTTPVSSIKNAKAVLVSVPSLEVNKEIELTIKIKPTNQKAGDVLVNDASMNSKLNLPVESQAVWTRVYGRELTGVVWYDDNLDGLIGNKAAGGLEEFAKDIPVKLYRTSLADENYKDKLVEASLTGEKFVDSSGNSLIKTDKDGKYTFAAIPEGTYVAEFVIGDRVEKKEFHVTKQQVGDDPTKNSKADPNTYKTPGYKAPLLEDLNGIDNVNTPTYKIENVNLGLIRPATIRLFKFETGSAVDANGDGKLSDEEKATGKPLKGATFEIYKKGETTPIATADTDTNGYLMFEYLYKGSYQLKETKAPEGYELIKEPIDVEVVEGNQNVALFASDDKSTELPFTGANKWVFGLLIGATITMVAGFGGITYYYRQPKKKGE